MSRRCVIFDPIQFAFDGQVLSGELGFAELSRLAGVLSSTEGVLSWSLEGIHGEDGRPYLRLSLRGTSELSCQRCLSALSWQLDHVSLLQLQRPGSAISDEELEIEEYDAIEAVADFDVLALIEDELLLAVPLVPKHDQCEPPASAGASEKKSPFDVLAKLRVSGKVQ